MLHAAIAAGVLFVGSTPCDASLRQFVGVRAGAQCERITWQLALSDPTTATAGYSLVAVYGMQAQSAPGFVDGGTRLELQGTWLTLIGRGSDPNAVVYRIAAGKPERTLDFLLLDDNLLHPLGENGALMVGNPSWSYTLSRQAPGPRPARGPYARWLERPAPSSENGGAVANVAGVFEGRTPCQDLARLLTGGAGADCTKIKWRLTLHRDPGAQVRGTYKLEGFTYRNPPRTGTWTTRTVPGGAGVVYQLDPNLPGGFLSLLRADDNILLMLDRQGHFLVGDIYYSYTLNRVK